MIDMKQVGSWLKPLWKAGAHLVIVQGGDALQQKIRGAVDEDRDASIKRVNKVFDGWQAGVVKALKGLWFLPAAKRDELARKVQEEGDKLQGNLVRGIKEYGPKAVDRAVDGFQERLAKLVEGA